MTGEAALDFGLGSAQPGGRAPAPGGLALVQSFLNTHYDLEADPGADLFDSPASLRRWLSHRRLIEPGDPVGARELEPVLAVRSGLRALIAEPGPHTGEALKRLNRAATGAAVEVRLTSEGPRWHPPAGGGVQAAIGLVLALSAAGMIEGSWTRLKLCPGRDCGWAFYDHSRNRTGRWCSMSVCGGRAKARAHYRRERVGP